jgi:DNA polymerase elongation subunit (family B)
MKTEKEQKLQKLADVKAEAKRYYNYEQSIKLMLNSIYGAFGNEYFYFFSIDLAETITLQGQDAILYTEKMVNKYFSDFWHKDTETHKTLGLTEVKPIKKPIGIYIDTDSVYMQFQEVIDNCDWQGDTKTFILNLYQIRLKEYIERVLEKYAEKDNSDNFLSFELESIARNAIWLAKKKYIQNLVWRDPNIHLDDLSSVKSKGFEIIQSSTPQFAREKLQEIMKFIFSQDLVKIDGLVALLKKIKKEFKLANIDVISNSIRINNYQKYILSDYQVFEIQKGCPINVRAAGYHNYLLNNSSHKGKYQLLSNGEKVKMYHSMDKSCDVFAYSPGNYPYQFAPPIDYELQFEKCIIDPINRVIGAIGLQTLDRNLIYTSTLF